MKKTNFILMQDHKEGTDLHLFSTAEERFDWKLDQAREGWDEAVNGEMPEDDEDTVDQYRDSLAENFPHGEYWTEEDVDTEFPEGDTMLNALKMAEGALQSCADNGNPNLEAILSFVRETITEAEGA